MSAVTDSGTASFYDRSSLTHLCREAADEPDKELADRFHSECRGTRDHTVLGLPEILFRCTCTCHRKQTTEGER